MFKVCGAESNYKTIALMDGLNALDSKLFYTLGYASYELTNTARND